MPGEDAAPAIPDRQVLLSLDGARGESGPLRAYRWAFVAFGVAFGAWHIATNIWLNEPGRWQNTIHFAGFALIASVTLTAFGRAARTGWALALDTAYGLVVAAAALWIAGAENGIYDRTLAVTGQAWQLTPVDWAAGLIVVFAAFDLARRVSGWVIPILLAISLAYILFLGAHLPGVFRAAALPLNDVLFRTLYNDEGMFGILAGISSTNIALFMIFGGFLVVSGASDFVIELSKIVAGRVRGGAAFVAVLSSALTGTISGSAIANTASTGVITIPLMKASGFRARFAAAVEASASTGGQLMPPIMGAGAFVMASYTAIPYATIVAASVVPAILYFLSVAFVVRIEAVKHRIGEGVDITVDRGKLASGGLTFVVPLAVMVWLLMNGVTPSYAAAWAIGVLVAVSWATSLVARIVRIEGFAPVTLGPARLCDAMLLGVKSAVMTGVLLVAIGIMNNAIVTSGVGNGFSLMIAQWSQGSVLVALVLIALASLVLGMGLPVTAAYIILAILTAPALAGILSDGLIVAKLMAGITDPAQAAMFMLVDSPHVAKVGTGMTYDEATALMAAMPFDLALTVRPLLVDPAQRTMFLLTAHLIIFWLSQDSNVTPPVCLAAFAAAGIAGSRPMATGFEAWKIAKGLYVVPLLFAYTPLVSGAWHEVLHIGFFALFGMYATNALLQLHAEGPLRVHTTVLLALGAVGAYWPLNLAANVAGALLVVAAIALSLRTAARRAAA